MSGDEYEGRYTAQMNWQPGMARVLAPDESWIAFVRNEDVDTLLSHLNGRSGSPEGWPEGADAEGAELVPACDLYDDINVWQRWSSLGRWEDLNSDVWKHVPGDVVVVARRKPKPVTRDVRADEVRGEVTVLRNGQTIRVWPSAHYFDHDSGSVAMVDFRFVEASSGAWQSLAAADLLAVLVEEPNG